MPTHKQEYEFSAPLRWGHWIRAISIFVLIVTGFYLADPFLLAEPKPTPTNFQQAEWRFWHLVFGFALIGVTIFKTHLFFFGRISKKERVSFWDFINPKVWFKQIGYYMLVSHHPETKGVYNPLQFVAYLTIFICIAVISLTGLIMYVHVFHEGLGGAIYDILRPIEAMMGGLAAVRYIHHIAMWVFILFIPVHVYMAVFNSVFAKNGAMDSIFSGYRFFKKH